MDPDSELMSALHDEHAGALFGFVSRYVDDPGQAEDAVQETLLRAWKHLDRLDTAAGNPRAYLFTIARNVLTDRWRATRSRPQLVHDEPALESVPAVDDIERAVESLLVADALRRLSAEHRQVVEQMYFQGRSVAEAAAQLGIPPGTVKSRSYYAVRALRSAFDEMGVTR